VSLLQLMIMLEKFGYQSQFADGMGKYISVYVNEQLNWETPVETGLLVLQIAKFKNEFV
jgi:hypothetical protein